MWLGGRKYCSWRAPLLDFDTLHLLATLRCGVLHGVKSLRRPTLEASASSSIPSSRLSFANWSLLDPIQLLFSSPHGPASKYFQIHLQLKTPSNRPRHFPLLPHPRHLILELLPRHWKHAIPGLARRHHDSEFISRCREVVGFLVSETYYGRAHDVPDAEGELRRCGRVGGPDVLGADLRWEGNGRAEDLAGGVEGGGAGYAAEDCGV